MDFHPKELTRQLYVEPIDRNSFNMYTKSQNFLLQRNEEMMQREPKRTIDALTHGAEPSLRSRQLRSYSRTSQHVMGPEGLLPCSLEPSTDPCPEPD
jgi:hypothetical protein